MSNMDTCCLVYENIRHITNDGDYPAALPHILKAMSAFRGKTDIANWKRHVRF
jgi:hypothetical protein